MRSSICILDLSKTAITGMMAIPDPTGGTSLLRWQPMSLRLPWDVGFQQHGETVRPLFGEALEGVDPADQEVIQFLELGEYLAELTDAQTVETVLGAFLEEIVSKHLPAPENVLGKHHHELYLILPSHWSIRHRNSLRRLIRERYSPNRFRSEGSNTPSIVLRACFPEILCNGMYALFQGTHSAEVLEQLRQHQSINLFMLHFTENAWRVWAVFLGETASEYHFEVRDDWRLPFNAIYETPEAATESLLEFIAHHTNVESPTLLSGFSDGSETHQTLFERLGPIPKTRRLSNEVYRNQGFWDRHLATHAAQTASSLSAFTQKDDFTLQGAGWLVKQFDQQAPPIEKPICCRAPLCVGVQLPDLQLVEMFGAQASAPCQHVKGFQVMTDGDPLDFVLFSGFSFTPYSALNRLATLSLQPDPRPTGAAHELIITVELEKDNTGRFSVYLPQDGLTESTTFALTPLFG